MKKTRINMNSKKNSLVNNKLSVLYDEYWSNNDFIYYLSLIEGSFHSLMYNE